MRRVIVESPYAASATATIEQHVAYARAAMADCLARGEAPFASHLLYPQVLSDALPEERLLGINAGFEWRAQAHATLFYVDYGVSKGMRLGMQQANEMHQIIEMRRLAGWVL